jgi:hypothetical protein
MQNIAKYHPSFRKKFSPLWLGPCEILDLPGRSAARLRLPDALQAAGLHDVFHFSYLKHYKDDSSTLHAPVASVPDAAGKSGEVFEVASVANFSQSRPREDTGVKAPHYLVRWVGYDDSYNTWLPVDELDGCLEKVADYLFTVVRPHRRAKLISQFPRASRDALLELESRAERTRRSVHGGKEAAQASPTPYTGKLTRARARVDNADGCSVQPCTVCAQWFPVRGD